MQRRQFVQASVALGALSSLPARASTSPAAARARVVVVGGGYGGATAARYVRLLSDHSIDVVLVEPQPAFVSCPLSNLVVGGSHALGDLTRSYTSLAQRHGVRVVQGWVSRLDPTRKTVTLADGSSLAYDKLILSPGVEMMWDTVEGAQAAQAAGQVLQAWKAGEETRALRQQLEAMPDGGVFAITVPELPYRCPPGPYERASQVAHYFRQAKPRSKVLVLDANPDVTSKGALFKKFWAEHYAGTLEYRPQHKATAVQGATRTVQFEIQDDLKADVLNVLPAMRAGSIAVQSGLANANQRWCSVDYLTFESTVAKDVHIIGDAVLAASLMPKSGHMANAQGKVAAAAVVAQLAGLEVNPQPLLANTCYSFLDDRVAVHVASVHQYVPGEKTYKTVAGAGGLSAAPSALEGQYALGWAHNIWADMLG